MPSAYGRIGWRDSQEEGPTNALGDRRRGRLRGPSPALVSRLTYLIIALYALTFAVLSVLDQDSFNTNAFDLGNMDQAVWNTAQGRWFQFTNWEGGTSRLAAHVEPILIPISLLYRLFASPATLLVLQSVVISLGALPAFWLAREKLRNDFAAVTFASAYLLAPALEVANLHDFHPVALASSLLLFAFYFVHRRWYVPFLIAALLAMGTKEQVPLSVAMLGVYIFLVQRRRFWGGLTVFLAVAWLAGAFLVIIPRFSATGTYAYLSRYDYLGASPGEILSNLVLHPGDVIPRLAEPAKANYLLGLFGPLAFLPLLSPATLLMALPDLAINLLSSFSEMYGLRAHYGAVIVPFLIVSAIYGAELLVRGIGRVSKTGGHLFLYLLCFAVLGLSLTGTGVLFPFFGTMLGWLGVALTGTDAGSNALFGNLQKVTAEQLNISPILMGAANSAGGVMGKMIDAQSIVVSSSATQQTGNEAAIFKAVFWHSLALAALVGVIVMFYAYVIPWIIPR